MNRIPEAENNDSTGYAVLLILALVILFVCAKLGLWVLFTGGLLLVFVVVLVVCQETPNDLRQERNELIKQNPTKNIQQVKVKYPEFMANSLARGFKVTGSLSAWNSKLSGANASETDLSRALERAEESVASAEERVDGVEGRVNETKGLLDSKIELIVECQTSIDLLSKNSCEAQNSISRIEQRFCFRKSCEENIVLFSYLAVVLPILIAAFVFAWKIYSGDLFKPALFSGSMVGASLFIFVLFVYWVLLYLPSKRYLQGKIYAKERLVRQYGNELKEQKSKKERNEVDIKKLKQELNVRTKKLLSVKIIFEEEKRHLDEINRAREQEQDRIRQIKEAERKAQEKKIAEERRLKWENKQINDLIATDWRSLSGIPFEEFLRKVFRAHGYEVKKTKGSNDKGGDLIVIIEGVKVAIQAKGWASSVGHSAIKEAHFAKDYYPDCDCCAVVTNSKFTPQARDSAEAKGIRCVLVCGDIMVRFIRDPSLIINSNKK